MKVYHGSRALFERPSNDKIEEGFDSSEFGLGFNTSTYYGDAHGHASSGGNPGVVYVYELEEDRLSNWFKSGEPIGQDIYDRIMERKDILPSTVSQKAFNELTPDSDGYKTHMVLGGRTLEGTNFLKQCGIEGALNGDYAIFFDANHVPPQKIHQVVGDFPLAKEALAQQELSGKLSVEQPIKADGTIVGPRKDYKSEELTRAAREIHKTGNQNLINAFENFATITLTDPEITKRGGDGFDIRNNYGLATSRSFKDSGNNLTDQWSGTSTFDRTNDWVQGTPSGAIISPAVTQLQEALTAHSALQVTKPNIAPNSTTSPKTGYTT